MFQGRQAWSQQTKSQTCKTPYRRQIVGVTFEVRKGSITDYKGSAIVNAANEQGLGGGGVDGAITKAGGIGLAKARRDMSKIWGSVRVRTGDARATVSGDLECDYVIHAVGPNLTNPEYSLEHLTAAYISSLSEAYRIGITDLAFPIISGGVFSGMVPQSKIINRAITACMGYANLFGVKKIVFYGFQDQEVRNLIQMVERQARP
jgi:O-acetyl-ADP-ribose deacetylase